uniref:Uncharacterized protein n=1 Tax=Anguilla anguilla TaxID=7936 RepID=A0A0E9P6E7_ANGAN
MIQLNKPRILNCSLNAEDFKILDILRFLGFWTPHFNSDHRFFDRV